MRFDVKKLDLINNPAPDYATIIQLTDRLNVLIEDFNQRKRNDRRTNPTKREQR